MDTVSLEVVCTMSHDSPKHRVLRYEFLLEQIFLHLRDAASIRAAGRTCRLWHRVINSPRFLRMVVGSRLALAWTTRRNVICRTVRESMGQHQIIWNRDAPIEYQATSDFFVSVVRTPTGFKLVQLSKQYEVIGYVRLSCLMMADHADHDQYIGTLIVSDDYIVFNPRCHMTMIVLRASDLSVTNVLSRYSGSLSVYRQPDFGRSDVNFPLTQVNSHYNCLDQCPKTGDIYCAEYSSATTLNRILKLDKASGIMEPLPLHPAILPFVDDTYRMRILPSVNLACYLMNTRCQLRTTKGDLHEFDTYMLVLTNLHGEKLGTFKSAPVINPEFDRGGVFVLCNSWCVAYVEPTAVDCRVVVLGVERAQSVSMETLQEFLPTTASCMSEEHLVFGNAMGVYVVKLFNTADESKRVPFHQPIHFSQTHGSITESRRNLDIVIRIRQSALFVLFLGTQSLYVYDLSLLDGQPNSVALFTKCSRQLLKRRNCVHMTFVSDRQVLVESSDGRVASLTF